MADYSKAQVHDWWYDAEFNEYCAILETIDHQLRFITNSKKDTPRKGES